MKAEKFETFLRNSGAEILKPTNEYEVVRFRTENGVSVMYQGKKGFSFTGEAKEALEAMQKKTTWTSLPQGLRKKKKILSELRKRDGDDCFYCGIETDDTNRTIEHLLSVADGGNNSLSNLSISCSNCNKTVGDMPIVEKVEYRDVLRSQNNENIR